MALLKLCVSSQPAMREIHLWWMYVDTDSDDASLTLLSSDERARADRFHFRSTRCRFVLTRAFLRRVLSMYVDIAPSLLAFRYGPEGKPSLVTHSHDDDICFNLAHSAHLALCAVGRGRHLGVDLEQIRPLPDVLALARRYFTHTEALAISSLPAEQHDEAFFRCWTLKEAYLKGTGSGLAQPLNGFQVSPAERVQVMSSPATDGVGWTLYTVEAPPGFVAALAVQGGGVTRVHRQWRDAPPEKHSPLVWISHDDQAWAAR